MSAILIKNGILVDPSQKLETHMDILIRDGVIEKIGRELSEIKDAEIIKADGYIVSPGFIDMHVHFRDPGLTYKEDIESGCKAAAAGGFTAVACMPNTIPVCDSEKQIRYIYEKGHGQSCKIYPIASVTMGMCGKYLTNFEYLSSAGAVAFSDDGKPVVSARMTLDALKEAANVNKLIISHCEDPEIVGNGIINKGKISEALGVPGIDRASEDCMTARDIALAESHGYPVHIAHVSTAGAVEIIRAAKSRGVPVTCETAPHYFSLTEGDLMKKDANFRMNPPLREISDRLQIIDGIRDGTIDVIATDHAPHSPEDKANFTEAPNGVIGLETSFAVSYTNLVCKGKIPLIKLISMISTTPAKLLKIPGGTLEPGSRADITIVDLHSSFTVDPNKFRSKSANSPFIGKNFMGVIRATILDGRIVYINN